MNSGGLSSVSCFVLQDTHIDTGPLGWKWGGSLTRRPREWPLSLERPLPSTGHLEERAPTHLFLDQTFFLQLQEFIPQRVRSRAGGRKELSWPFSCSVFGGKGRGPTYLRARVALGSHHAKLLKGSLGSGQQLAHAPGISVVLPRVPFMSPGCQEASVHAVPSFWQRWSTLPGLSESVLELPSDVPAGGISWEPWPRPGGSLITRALGRKEGRGREPGVHSFSFRWQRLVFSGPSTMKAGLRTAAGSAHWTLRSAGPDSSASCVPHPPGWASGTGLGSASAAAPGSRGPGITWMNRWAGTSCGSCSPSPDNPSQGRLGGNGVQRGEATGFRHGAGWRDPKGPGSLRHLSVGNRNPRPCV